MPVPLTRRRFLRQGTALAGLCATGGMRRVLAAPSPAGGQGSRSAPSLPVAIERCASYEPLQLMARLNRTLDLIGGIDRLMRGKTVTVKLNLTGGPRWRLGGLPAHRTYHVHPNFVAATCAALHEAGAAKIILVESGYDRRPLDEVMAAADWDVPMIAAAGGRRVHWEDTRNQSHWTGYSRLAVPWGGYIYPSFDLNRRYEKTDVFVSLAKLKDHANAGVTMSVKNLFGIAPTSIYGDNYDGSGRASVDERCVSARGDTLHKGTRTPPEGVSQECDPSSSRHWSHRVPRVTADLFGARPADLCLIDGIETNRGGEGPWVRGVEPVRPGLLLAGRNGVCTDAIATAAMGYDPAAAHGEPPFMGDNHLTLLADQGVGTNVADRIEVRGVPLKEALFPFNPDRQAIGAPLFG